MSRPHGRGSRNFVNFILSTYHNSHAHTGVGVEINAQLSIFLKLSVTPTRAWE